MNTAMRSIDLIRNLQSFFPCSSLLIICKPFILPLLDYNGVYDQASNK